MRAGLEHKLKYIYWAKEAQYIRLSNEDYAAKLAWYKEHGTSMSEENKTDREAWITTPLPTGLTSNINGTNFTRGKTANTTGIPRASFRAT